MTLETLAIAAILAFIFNLVKDAVQDERLHRRERNGLLRILYEEVDHNQSSLAFVTGPYDAGCPDLGKKNAEKFRRELVQTEAWEATRLKLAQLLSSQEFATIASYYSNLLYLRAEVDKEPGEIAIDADHVLFKLIRKKGEKVVEIITKRVPDVTQDPITVNEMMNEHARMTGQTWPPEDASHNTN
jgi:hypothetical protein